MEAYYWLIAMAVLLLVEIMTMGLTTIWFAAGALLSFFAATFGLNEGIQFIFFFATSILMLVFTRPLAKRYFNSDRKKTNYESLIGQEARVIADVDNFEGKGRIVVNGQEWTARSSEGEAIATDTKVTIERIEGVKAIVKRM